MKNIRLLALDLEDTLLRSDFSVSYRTKTAVKRTEALGITVALVSGRIPADMERFSKTFGLNKRPGFLMCNNGALVMESNTGKVIYETRIEPGIALAICELADAEGFAVQRYEDDIMYVSRQNEYTSYDEKITGIRQVVVEHFHDMLGSKCYKLLIPGDPMLLNPLESLIRTYLENDITLFAGRPYFLEILPPNTNKGIALAKIAESIGVTAEETMAIGDSLTDQAMIEWAGTGVCMVNGDEQIKKIAQIVTDLNNDEDGAAEIINRYILARE
ncbi:MAG: Cof-type HAD-IIB family hydrolase [Treponema sp.]|nr:Cof-type HAD-IIB family hydrolase [Treponema sp.]